MSSLSIYKESKVLFKKDSKKFCFKSDIQRVTLSLCSLKRLIWNRGGSSRVAKSLQESILITFDFIWKVMLSDRYFSALLDPPLWKIFISYIRTLTLYEISVCSMNI